MNLTTSGTGPPVQRREDLLLAEMRRTKSPGMVGRERLDEVRAELWERHQAGAGGLEIVKVYTEATFIGAAPTPVFDVKTFGAKGDGTTNDEAAIQKLRASGAVG